MGDDVDVQAPVVVATHATEDEGFGGMPRQAHAKADGLLRKIE
jgi:hypothetical protein